MGCKFFTVFTYVRVMSEWMKGLFFISSCATPYWMSCWASLKVSWLIKWINYDQVRVMGLLLNSGQLRKRGRPGLQWYHFSGLIVENSLQGWVKLCSCHAPRSKKTTSWIKWQIIITDEVSLGVGVLRECIVRHLFTGMGPAGSGSPAATWLVEDCGRNRWIQVFTKRCGVFVLAHLFPVLPTRPVGLFPKETQEEEHGWLDYLLQWPLTLVEAQAGLRDCCHAFHFCIYCKNSSVTV